MELKMAAKDIVADLNKGKKLDGKIYDIRCRKIQYLLNKQEVLETLDNPWMSLKNVTLLNIAITLKPTKIGARKITVHASPC